MTGRGEGEAGPSMLAVVRCGDNSLHESWTSGNRHFDFAISYFGDAATQSFPGAAYVERRKGGKWDGLYGFFEDFPDAVERYDYFWFPDDDIAADALEINRLIEIGHRHELALFQPALDNQSYHSHLITLRHSSFTLRYSNFVEIMAPVLSRDLLKLALPTIAQSRSGFGLDFVWPELAANLNQTGQPRAAIIDSVTVRHTRPVGGSLHTFIKSLPGARSTKEELESSINTVAAKSTSTINGVSVPRIRMVGGLSSTNKKLTRVGISARALVDLTLKHRNKVQAVKTTAALRHALKTLI
jgi:hypothetical protein